MVQKQGELKSFLLCIALWECSFQRNNCLSREKLELLGRPITSFDFIILFFSQSYFYNN